MKKKLVVLLSLLLVATNTLYVSAAPAIGVGDSDIVIVEEEESEEVSEEEISEEEISEEVSEEEISEEEKSEEEESEEDSQEEESEEADSEEADSEESSEVMDFDDKEIKNIDDTDDERIDFGETSGDWQYEIYNNWSSGKYVVITKYTGYGTSVTIPTSLSGVKVTQIGSSAFSGKSTIEKLTIPSNVTSIGTKAFYNCSSLTTLNLSEGLKEIGYGAFENCVSLKSVVIPSTVETVRGDSWDGGAFENCSGLTSITIKGSSVGPRMFYGCTSLTYVKIPSSVATVGYDAFHSCAALKSAAIEVTDTIGDSAFSECLYLENVTLKNVKTINREAFYKTSVKTLNCPATLTSIGYNAFYDCQSLSTLTLNSGLASIGYGAFGNCISLKKVVIPATVTTLGSNSTWDSGAFQGCVGLTSVTINGTHIGAETFYGCTGLTEILIPRSVNYIGSYAFGDCSSLKTATIKSSGVICSNAFTGCSQLTTVTMKDGLFSEIGTHAFEGTPVKSISLPKTVTYIGDYAFQDCTGLTNLSLNNGILTIEDGAFRRCSSLTSVIVPVTLTNVSTSTWDAGIFEGCTSLRDVTVKGTVIGANMFYGCTALKQIVLPKTVSKIYGSAFNHCSSLTTATFLGNAPATFGNNVFDYTAGSFKIEFLDKTTGWTTPEWNGYTTKKVTKISGDVCAIFEDVKPGDYYVDAVQYLYNKGIMTGKTQTEFGAASQVKREQVVTVLYAAAGKPAVSGTSGFPDVKSTDYFNNAVIWAKKNKITSGLGDGSFGVGNSISRESLAMMLYGYAKFKGIKTKKTAGASNGFSDSSQISSYAKDAMDWAVTQGIISGKGTGSNAQKRLDPKGKAARSEFAVMMAKLLK